MILKDIEVGRLNTKEPHVVPFTDPMHLCDFFIRLLGKYDSGKANKIVITLIEPDLKELNSYPIERNRPVCPVNVIMFYRDFNFAHYDQSNSVTEKKNLLWNELFFCMLLCCKAFDWDENSIIRTYEKGLELKLINDYFFSKCKISPNRKYQCRVLCRFDLDSFQCFAVFYDAKGDELDRQLLLKESPSFGWYEAHNFSSVKWITSNQIALFDKYNNKWTANSPDLKSL
ncbi:MAG TPA: hypothetical protein VK174_05295 [Chitinophagales bacterium]|nr:hypothetical protein [Chitinophagales bacterium]